VGRQRARGDGRGFATNGKKEDEEFYDWRERGENIDVREKRKRGLAALTAKAWHSFSTSS